MPPDSLAVLPNLPLVHAHHPATFLERGVSVPFTTPLLLGARVRPADRGGIELIVPNPAGGLGVYILPWTSLIKFRQPTVHDTRLHQRIVEREAITPATIRDAARLVAAEGLAGRDAAAAATAASAADTRDRLAANFLLLLAAIRQTSPTGKVDEMALASQQELRRRAKYAIEQIAPRLGRATDTVFNDIEQLASLLTPIGLDDQQPPARVPRLLARIERLRNEITLWAREYPGDSASAALIIAKIAGVTITCTEITLAEARACTDDVADLLARWLAAPEQIGRWLARSEWLVDGWEPICLLWQGAATQAGRHAALAEISLLVPLLPKEVAGWLSRQVDIRMMSGMPRIVPADTDWRTGMHFERVARNERLRALAV